jgi:hypothetical protein
VKGREETWVHEGVLVVPVACEDVRDSAGLDRAALGYA